jgi:thiol-disulfide isomerase/thioredoxin
MGEPDALMVLAPGCPHCPQVLESLARLVKEGRIGRLEVINAALRPEAVQALGVRGVPWVKLGPIELQGLHGPEELRLWAEKAGTPEGVVDHLQQLLAKGGLARATALLRAEPHHLSGLLRRMARPDLPLQVQLGIGALVEEFAYSEALAATLPVLAELSRHADHRVRSDACHFLGLTRRREAEPLLRERLADDNAEVREIAAEALTALP